MIGSLFYSSLLVALTISFALTEESDTTILVDNCKDLDDGSYYMQLIEDSDDDTTYPIVKIKCSNGYAILDVDYDSNLVEYFTSWNMWHTSIAGPNNGDYVDWDNWFIKSRTDSTNKFILSPDCTTCEEDHTRQHFDTKTTYWMSGNLFGCYWMILGKHNCDLNKETYACYDCSDTDAQANGGIVEITEDSDPSAYDSTGQCATAVRSSDSVVTASHDTCEMGFDWVVGDIDGSGYEDEYDTNVVSSSGNSVFIDGADSDDDTDGGWDLGAFGESQVFKPSIGVDGRFCVCTQSDVTNYITVDSDKLTAAQTAFEDANTEEDDTSETKTVDNNRVELYQTDFESGTYRIFEAGTYVIMEDIVFDFNAGSLDDPQAQGAWKPTDDQVDEYPGAGVAKGRDEYFLGFWAGITIECDDVVIDLNEKTLKMSDVFYHQQRWFTTISLTSQFFLPGNGPGHFGYNTKCASNVVIKDGTLGLSSHFGIHGNYNSHVIVKNVNIRDFEVHGIQFNGFEDISLKNLDIGPSSTKAFLKGEYGHMRYVLDRLNNAIDELDDPESAVMNFYGRDSMTMSEVADKLERMMNYAFDYVVQGLILDEDDENYDEYSEAYDLFVNPTGIPYASVLHGIFLNTKEASVMNYNLYTTTYSETATLENIKIHDLQHAMDERVRLYNGVVMFFGPFQNSLNARQLFGDDVVDDGEYFNSDDIPYNYAGSIVTDTYLTLTKYSDSWDYKEHMVTGQHILVPWSEGEAQIPGNSNIACNMDVMIHSGKGTTGLRLDGVKDISVKNIEIYNLHDSTPKGETVCGEYTGFTPEEGGGHLVQQDPMQVGFSGNMVQAITLNSAYEIELDTVSIHDLESETGLTYGISLWPANQVTLKGDLSMKKFNAGSMISDEESTELTAPNNPPQACAIMVYEYFTKSDEEYTLDVTFDYDSVSSCGLTSFNTDCYNYDTGAGGGDVSDDANSEWYEIAYGINNNGECSDVSDDVEVGDGLIHGSLSEEKVVEASYTLGEQLWGVFAVIAGVIAAGLLLYCVRKKCDYNDNRLKSVYLESWDNQKQYGSIQ